jgi:hypothetical protein
MGPKVSVLYHSKLERLASDKHTSLLGRFIGYAKNEVLHVRSQVDKYPSTTKAAHLSVTKFTAMFVINLATPEVGLLNI